MSAYIVDRETIDTITTAAVLQAGDSDNARSIATTFGRALWTSNVDAVAYRYPNDTDGHRPGPVGFHDADAGAYEWTRSADALSPDMVLEAIDTLDYQCSELSGWTTSDTAEILYALRAATELRRNDLDEAELAARAEQTTPTISYNTVQTAAELRKALRAQFPGVAFSVRMARGTAYGWLDVSYTDGPEYAQVREVADRFESERFSGQDDSYHRVAPTLYLIDGVPTEVRYSCCGINIQQRSRMPA